MGPAGELAELLCQSAGVMLAVPCLPIHQAKFWPTPLQQPIPPVGENSHNAGTNGRGHPSPSAPLQRPLYHLHYPQWPPLSPLNSTSLPNPPLLPASLLPRHLPQRPSALEFHKRPLGVGVSGHPKTPHTSIERRYHTNLTARVQSLRMAVPALRVPKDRTDSSDGRNIKSSLKDGVHIKGAGGWHRSGGWDECRRD